MSDGPVTEQHLDLLIVGRQVPRGVAAVFILPAPLVPRGSELVGSQGAAARREAAGDHNAPLPIPALVALQHFGMHCHILYQASHGCSAQRHWSYCCTMDPICVIDILTSFHATHATTVDMQVR